MAPKRPRETYNILLDANAKALVTDEHGRTKVAFAYYELTNTSYILRREWVKDQDSHKPQKAGWWVATELFDNPGVTSWSVAEATEHELKAVSESSGFSNLFPYVYVIKQRGTPSGTLFKVGCSFTPEKRLKQLQIGNPYRLEVHAKHRASNKRGDVGSMFACERAVHLALRDYGGPNANQSIAVHMKDSVDMNNYSEWFWTEQNDLTSVDSLVKMAMNPPQQASSSSTAAARGPGMPSSDDEEDDG
jgi:hypothetical protein